MTKTEILEGMRLLTGLGMSVREASQRLMSDPSVDYRLVEEVLVEEEVRAQ